MFKDLIEKSEQCHKEVALEYFTAFTGQKDELKVVGIMERYPELYSKETLDRVSKSAVEGNSSGRQGRFMLEIFTGNYLTDQLKEMSQNLVNDEGALMVEVDNEEIPYRALPIQLGNEADYDKRGRLDTAYLSAMDSLNSQRKQISQQQLGLVESLGYRNTIDLATRVSNLRVYELRDLMLGFLDSTENIYEDKLAQNTKEHLGIGRSALRHADLGFLLRGKAYDSLFPQDQLVPALGKTLVGLGIDLDSQTNVTLDLETRPKKSPRAFCIGIDVPHDIRLSLAPHGGQDDYSTLFHEAGHLQFGAHMAPGLEFIYRQHGDTSVHESYAFLLQHLVDDPAWWREVMGVDPGGYIAFAKFKRLYMLRRYSAKLQYEVEFYEQGGGQGMAEAYTTWLERGCLVAYPRERYLSDFDNGFYVLQYLQAWIWEVQLRAHLKAEFGDAWFTNRRAGDFLRELWKDGMKYDVWEIAQKLGYGGLDIGPLTEELAGE